MSGSPSARVRRSGEGRDVKESMVEGTTAETAETAETTGTGTETETTVEAAAAVQDAAPVKVRKPYTITKKREKWSEEEHALFVESLKKYGRAWRKIEAHIGTKTAVQIRSHAQKFFSKLQKEQHARAANGSGDGNAQSDGKKRAASASAAGGNKKTKTGLDKRELEIEIPPARPKRKPAHPYPKKATSQQPSRGSGDRNSGGTGKSSQTEQKMVELGDNAEAVANASSSAAVAAVLSVASDKMQNNLQQDIRASYFGISPPPMAGMFPQAGLFPMHNMMNPYLGMANPAAGAQNPPQMSNPQQFVNYINFLTNMWQHNAAVMGTTVNPTGMPPHVPANMPSNATRTQGAAEGAAGEKLGTRQEIADGNAAKKGAFTQLGGMDGTNASAIPYIPTAKVAPYGVPIAPEQLSPYFASIMQAAALGYMCAPNTSPIVGMSGFVANSNAGVGADAPRAKIDDKKVPSNDTSDGSDGSDDYKLEA